MRRPALLAATISGLCALSPAVAGAQTPGLHVDPNSPTGHEYAIPLDQARGNAAPGSGATGGNAESGGQAAAPRFGVGVAGAGKAGGGPGSGGSAGSGGAGSGGSGSGSGGKAGSGSGPHAATVGSLRLDTASANPPSSAATSLLVAGIAAAVLLLGALAGLLARRGRTRGRES